MRNHLYSLLPFIIATTLFFTACRNEPKLDDLPKETVVKTRISGDPESLGYLFVTDSKALQIIRQIFLPLTDFEPETYNMVPALAKSLPKITEITEGDLAGNISYEFEIKDEATWFDGSPVTGNDYLFTVKAVFNPNAPSIYPGQFRGVKKIEVDAANPKKFIIYSRKYMMGEQSYGNFAPLPAHIFDPKGILKNYTLSEMQDKEKIKDKEDLKKLAADFTSPIFLRSPEVYKGSGPYHLTSWTTGQEIVLEKKVNWWGDKLAKTERILVAAPSKIIYKMIPDVNAAISLMKNGELDIMTQVDWTTFLKEKKDAGFNKDFNFYTPDRYVMRMMNFNTANEKLTDKKVRRAIAHLFDTEEVFKTVYYGYPTAIVGPVYPTKDAYNKSLKLIDYNVEKAKSLLKEAGWEDTNGNGIVDKKINGQLTELELKLSIGDANKDYIDVATIFQSTAIKAGVNISPDIMESSAWFKTLKSKTFEMTFSGISDYPFNMDPASKWHSRGSVNYSSFGTAESDALIIELRKTVDVNKQNELSKKLQEIIYDEQPGIFICAAKDRIISAKKFGKITTYGLTPGYFVNELADKNVIAVTSNNN